MNIQKESLTMSDNITSLIPVESLDAFSSIDNGIVLKHILSVFVFSEISIQEELKEKPWMHCAPELNKSRIQHDFDNQLQHMLVYCDHIGFFKCDTIPCSNAYSRTKLESEKDSCVLLVFHSYNSDRKYLQKYFQLNENIENPAFLFFQYDLDSDQHINNLTLCIPNAHGDICKSFDLQVALEKLRNYYQDMIEKEEIDSELQKIKSYSKNLIQNANKTK